MIDFSSINKPDWRYSMAYPWVRWIHNSIYYRKFAVIHRERLPQKGEGYLVVCNHQNGLNDALGILCTLGGARRPVFIARGDIFKKEGIAKVLRFLRILPAFRVRDAGVKGLSQNEAIFEESARILNEGDVVALFPEAGHQKGHFLGGFHKGFARIAFKAVEDRRFEGKLRIVPMAHHYSNYFSAQSKLAIIIGEPFDFTDLYDLYREDPNRAIALLNDRAQEKVRELMLDISDREHYDQYILLCGVNRDRYLKGHHLRVHRFHNELTADKGTTALLDRCREEEPEVFARLMDEAGRYGALLKELRLRDWIIHEKVGLWFPIYLLTFLLALPLWLYGALFNCLPLLLIERLKKGMADRMLHASVQMGVSVLVLPIWHLILFGVAWAVSGKLWIALIVLASLYPALLVYVRTRVFLIKMYHRARRLIMSLKGEPKLKEALRLRETIVQRLDDVKVQLGE